MVMSELQNLFERLSNAHGASGYEGSVRQVIEKEVRSYVDYMLKNKKD